MDVYTLASYITPYLRGKDRIHIIQCEGKEQLNIFYHRNIYQIVHDVTGWTISNMSKGWYRTYETINAWDDGKHVRIGMGKHCICIDVGDW